MAGSKLDQIIEVYVKSILSEEEKNNLASVERVVDALKNDILSDLREKGIQRARRDAEEEKERYMQNAITEAKNYKKGLIRKAQKKLIIEAIFVAFWVGMIVNQATYLWPEGREWACVMIVVALLICSLLVHVGTGKD